MLLIHYVTVVCAVELKKKFVCVLWLSVHMKSFIEQGFFHEFAFNNNALKTFVKFQI